MAATPAACLEGVGSRGSPVSGWGRARYTEESGSRQGLGGWREGCVCGTDRAGPAKPPTHVESAGLRTRAQWGGSPYSAKTASDEPGNNPVLGAKWAFLSFRFQSPNPHERSSHPWTSASSVLKRQLSPWAPCPVCGRQPSAGQQPPAPRTIAVHRGLCWLSESRDHLSRVDGTGANRKPPRGQILSHFAAASETRHSA